MTGNTGRASGWDKINLQNLPRGGALRKAMLPPEGYSFVVGDSSQIEARMVAWLAGQRDLVEDFRRGEDIYSKFASILYERPITKAANPTERHVGKTCILGLGYGLAHVKLRQALATGKPSVVLSEETTKEYVTKYRMTYRHIPNLWYRLGDYIVDMAEGATRQVGPATTCKDGILLPNGMRLNYEGLFRARDGWFYCSEKRQLAKYVALSLAGKDASKVFRPQDFTYLYGGKVTENCIAGGTQVLTNRGWVPIEQVRDTDLVHDGVQFVSHAGVVFKAMQPCISIDGVRMTSDHEVLTNDGWKAASQDPQPFRPDLRGLDLPEPGTQQQKEALLALPPCLWEAVREGGHRRSQGSNTRRDSQLRVHDWAAHNQEAHHAWHVEAPGVCRVAQHGRPLPLAIASGMEELRRTWNYGVRKLASVFCELLGRHGAYLRTGVGLGPHRQQWPVLATELPLGFAPCKHYEQTQYGAARGCAYAEPPDRDSSHHTVLSASARLPYGAPYHEAKPEEPVYDIVNAGPRHRFVVRGDSGPFIVHNCVQALARIIVFDQMLELAAKYRVVLTVHDEVVLVVPDADVDTAKLEMERVMSTPPKWAPDLPVACEVHAGKSYGGAK